MNKIYSKTYKLLKSILWTTFITVISTLIFANIFPSFGVDALIIIYGSSILITLIYCTYTIIEKLNKM